MPNRGQRCSKFGSRLRIVVLFFLAWMVFLIFNYNKASAVNAPSLAGPESFPRIADTAGPAVVNIRTERIIEGGGPVFRHYYKGPGGEPDLPNSFMREESERKYKMRSLGSGFIIDPYGHIATNHHVIYGADNIKVRLQNGREFDAEFVGSDPYTDLALIKIHSRRILPTISMGNSENLKVGQWVAAIGSPFGLEHTLTVGIVSAKGRAIGIGAFDDFIQTDAAINPGNSGGPLINVHGEVVGVASAMFAGNYGIGFAVPINMAKGIFQQLKEHGEVSRAWLGVVVHNLSDSLYKYFNIDDGVGVMVSGVYEGHPADEGGIEHNDIIREINGAVIKSKTDVARAVSMIRVGDIIDIKVLRSGNEMMFRVVASRREIVDPRTLTPSKGPAYSFDIKVGDMSDEMRTSLNKQPNDRGVVVEEVEPGGKGEKSGIQIGDIIKEVNHLNVTSLEVYKRIARSVKKGEMVQMLIERTNVGYIVVKLRK